MRCTRRACVYCDDHTGECGHAPIAGPGGIFVRLAEACGWDYVTANGCDACTEVEPEALDDCQGGSCRL